MREQKHISIGHGANGLSFASGPKGLAVCGQILHLLTRAEIESLGEILDDARAHLDEAELELAEALANRRGGWSECDGVYWRELVRDFRAAEKAVGR